ncbi:nucleoside-diphosphate kinase [bacterium]|nr:nucleoside-diphosphate kinase [bacterium]
MLEWSLLNIKPDAVARNIIGQIIHRVENAGYRIIAIDKVQLEREEAEAFYDVHRDKPFFTKLCDYISSGPCVPMVVEGEEVIQGLRDLIGATDPAEAAPGTIRKDFALNGTQNSVHASDSSERAAVEINFFFSRHKLYLLTRNEYRG